MDYFFSTTEDDIIVDQVTSDDVVDDFELGKEEVVDIEDKEINKQKLRRRIDQYKVCSEFCAFKVFNFNIFECVIGTNTFSFSVDSWSVFHVLGFCC